MRVSPEQSFYVHDVAVVREVLWLVAEEVAFKHFGNAVGTPILALGLHGAEENSHRPHIVAQRGIAQTTVCRGMTNGIVDAHFAFRNQRAVAQQVAEAQKAVGVVGRLLVPPPV